MQCADAKDGRGEPRGQSREPGELQKSQESSPSRGDSTRKDSAHLIGRMVRVAVSGFQFLVSKPETGNMKLLIGCWMRNSRVFVDHAALHHEINMLQRPYIGQGIGIHCNDVGKLSGFNRTHIFRPADQVGGA